MEWVLTGVWILIKEIIEARPFLLFDVHLGGLMTCYIVCTAD